LRATRCVIQSYDGEGLRDLLSECLILTYNAIAYAQEHGIDNRKGMKGFYRTLKDQSIPSCYKMAAISRACEVVASRKRSQKRAIVTHHPKPLKSMICLTSAFIITFKGPYL
jgi:hypothetical protein